MGERWDVADRRGGGGEGGSCDAVYHLLPGAGSSPSRRLPALDARAAVAEVNPAFTAVLFAARILRLVAAAFSATDFLGVLGRSGRRASLL
jgi:hypothetical protein